MSTRSTPSSSTSYIAPYDSDDEREDTDEMTTLIRDDSFTKDSADTAPPHDLVEAPAVTPRPPIDYSSPSAFFRSFAIRFRSIWTRRFVLSLVAGQVVSLCITCTNVTTTELVQRNWALPTTQTFFL